MNESKELIISKWYETGVLDDLEGIVKEKVALAFEEVTNFLDLENVSDKNFDDSIFLFPLVRRVLNNIKNDKYVFNIEEFLELFHKHENALNLYFKKNEYYFLNWTLDREAEKCGIIADLILGEINE